MLVIGDLLLHNARLTPEREALVFGNQRLTWDALNRSVNRLANGLLAHGIGPGDRVAFIMGNNVDIVRLYYAVAKIGAVSVPIMARSVAREIIHIVNDVAASAIIATADQAAAVLEALPHLASVKRAYGIGADHHLPFDLADLMDASDAEPPISVDPDQLYAIQFTSGTTGAPKGCMLRHRNKVLSRLSMLSYVAYEETDRALLFMPLTASLGADMLHTHVLRGMTTVLVARFDEEEMLSLLGKERISVIYALQSTFDRLVAHEKLAEADWSHLRFFFGDSATRDSRPGMTKLRQLPHFKAKSWNAYGCTEGGGWLTFLSPDDFDAGVSGAREDVFRSIGRECMLAEVDCVGPDGNPVPVGEVGEMTLEAPWLFSGYWNQPEKTAEALRDGRYFTGDLARKDAQGYVYLEGRMKDMIKTGGVNVYPAEIEMVLKAHPKVKEVAVVGVSDPNWGEKVVACVIASEACEAAELIEYCKIELAGYKVPKEVAFMTDFPRDIVGKILKRALRDKLAA